MWGSWQAPPHVCIGASALAQTRSPLCFVGSQNSTAANQRFCLPLSCSVESHYVHSTTVYCGFKCCQISVSVWSLKANVQAFLSLGFQQDDAVRDMHWQGEIIYRTQTWVASALLMYCLRREIDKLSLCAKGGSHRRGNFAHRNRVGLPRKQPNKIF